MTTNDLIVLHEDNHLLVVVKPQNMPSQPDSSGDLDLLTLCKQYIKQKYDKAGEAYVGLVHRLDRPTGGVMVFARTSKAASRLFDQQQSGELDKRYVAITCAVPRDRSARLTNYLVKNAEQNTVRVVPATTAEAKKAVLDYKVLDEREGLALIDVRLLTGRSHQIRVQMSHIGCPLVGDHRYGGTVLTPKLALWAYQLTFCHPTTKTPMTFRVFPPTEDGLWDGFAIDTHLMLVSPS